MACTRGKIPYKYPHKTRKDRVDYICGIGGYSRFNESHYPIEFNVAAYATDFDFDHLWERYAKNDPEGWLPFKWAEATPDVVDMYYRLTKRLHKENESCMWGWGQEDAYHSLTDDDTYRMLWDGTMVKVKLELHGRGGKHLCITEFDGHGFSDVSPEDLAADLMRQTNEQNDYDEETGLDKLRRGWQWNWTNKEVETLYKYVRQCEVDFTQEKAAAEVEYQGAFCFFNNIVNSEWESELKDKADHDAVIGAACEVRMAVNCLQAEGTKLDRDAELDAAFALLCRAANVTEEEMDGYPF